MKGLKVILSSMITCCIQANINAFFLFKVLEILLENKVCVKGRDVNDKLPLHIAAETGSLDCVIVFSRFPDFTSLLNERDENGMTALHLAASNKHT